MEMEQSENVWKSYKIIANFMMFKVAEIKLNVKIFSRLPNLNLQQAD